MTGPGGVGVSGEFFTLVLVFQFPLKKVTNGTPGRKRQLNEFVGVTDHSSHLDQKNSLIN